MHHKTEGILAWKCSGKATKVGVSIKPTGAQTVQLAVGCWEGNLLLDPLTWKWLLHNALE